MATTMPALDSEAPNFDLKDHMGQVVRLADLRGQWVVLYFYPKDDTPSCTNENIDFSTLLPKFKKAGVSVIGVSKDPLKSHEKFAAKYDLKVPLASDADDDVIERYDAWVMKTLYGREYMGVDRSTYLIDGEGVLRGLWRKVRVKNHAAEVLKAAEALR